MTRNSFFAFVVQAFSSLAVSSFRSQIGDGSTSWGEQVTAAIRLSSSTWPILRHTHALPIFCPTCWSTTGNTAVHYFFTSSAPVNRTARSPFLSAFGRNGLARLVECSQ